MALPIMKHDDLMIDRSRYDEANAHDPAFEAPPGVNEEVVRTISASKNEPEWMLQKRLQGLKLYQTTPFPAWGPDLGVLIRDIDKIKFFVRPKAKESARWEDLPEDIRRTYERIGIPEAEKKSLSGVGAQYDSDVVYHSLKKEWEDQGVVFTNMDVAVQKYPALVQKYFMTSCVPINDHKFVMLHAAVWSGGTFIYVPKNVKVRIPLQAYFRMNAERGGQFEHTLIIADEGSEISYIEGCSAPAYESASLHAGCVEIHVMKNARVRYSSVENWSRNTYNLNTKRAIVQENGIIEWINGNLGCLKGDAQVFTNPKGPVKIKDLKPGDKVFAWDQKTNTLQRAKVKAMIPTGTKLLYKVQAGGREIEATANHPFLTITRQKRRPDHKKGFFQYEWKSLSLLKPGDLIAIAKRLPVDGKPFVLPKQEIGALKNSVVRLGNRTSRFSGNRAHLYNDIAIPEETSADFMWLAGLLIGDGHIDSKRNKINIATHESEDYRELLISTLKSLFNYAVTEKKDRYVIINSKQLCRLFTDIGFGGTADRKRVPRWVFTLPEDQILAFLAGYFDSDGHPTKNALALTSANYLLLKDIRLLAVSVGLGVSQIFRHGYAKKAVILGNTCNAKDSWRLHLNGSKVFEMPARSKRKSLLIQKIKTKRNFVSARGLNFKSKVNEFIGFAKIDSITEFDIAPTYDIEVEEYHNFIADGMIVHNSGVTMLYPCSVLAGKGARSDSLGIAFAGAGQNQDTGSKVIHAAPDTFSTIAAKSISKDGGISTYRGLVKVMPNATGSKVSVNCDALLIGEQSTSNTYPMMKIENNQVDIAHEATVGRIGTDEIFYLMSRGLSEEQARQMVVAGFIEPVVKQLPLEYSVELNKLIELEMEGSVG